MVLVEDIFMPDPSHEESGRDNADVIPEVKTKHSSRPSSARCSVVYPEAEDEGKPKFFARQSFVVTEEDDDMADAILLARKLAMERRRSVVEEAGGQAAASLPHKPSSYSDVHDASHRTEISQSEAVAPDLQRRRSSVLHRVPDKLKVLLQQSDVNGVQKKMDHVQRLESEQATTAGFAKASISETDHSVATRQSDELTRSRHASTDSSESSPASSPSRGFCGVLLSCFRTYDVGTQVVLDDVDEKIEKDTSKEAVHTITSTPESKDFASQSITTLLPKQSSDMAGRKLLVLDLDETLVHSSFKPVPNSDYTLEIGVDGTLYNVYVLKRPGVDEFLERVSQCYEVVVFTASLPQYANPLLDLLDPKGLIQGRLFRQVREYFMSPTEILILRVAF